MSVVPEPTKQNALTNPTCKMKNRRICMPQLWFFACEWASANASSDGITSPAEPFRYRFEK
jgi:hypothetical protein